MASACEAEQANVSCESESEQPAADPVAEVAPTVAIDENTVVFAKVEKAGYADQLKDLPADQKELYKQLKEHIATFGDTKEIVANKYETVNYKGRNLLVRIQIRKAQLLLKSSSERAAERLRKNQQRPSLSRKSCLKSE